MGPDSGGTALASRKWTLVVSDLQNYLRTYEKENPGGVKRVPDEVPRSYFTTAATLEIEKQPDPPVLIFENVQGLDMPVVTGLFSSRARIAHALGTEKTTLHQHWIERSNHLISPVEVEAGVCQEVVRMGEAADAETLPLLTHFEQDAGRYITSGVSVARDPDHGWGNLSFARMQLKGPRRFGISLHSRGHMWDYLRRSEDRGQDLEVAVVIGMHPAFLVGAASRVGIEVDEYDIVGALMGAPLPVVSCKTVDLQVPANAEIVIEGVIKAGLREKEGPFGEYTGYATDRSTQNVFEVRAITHRKNPIFLDVTPGASRDHLFLGRIQKEAEVLRKIRQILPNVTGIHYPTSGTHYHCYVAMKKQRPGDGRHAAILILGLDAYVKFVVVVDDDIDISNEAEVMWALATRMQPAEDISIIDPMTCNVLDPSSENGLSSKLAIDATRPLDWEAQRCTVPDEVIAKVKDLL